MESPGVSFLDYDYAPKNTIDTISIALATIIIGSSHIPNLHFIMQLAALKMKMSMKIVSAVTINSQAAWLNEKLGSIEIGKQADFAAFDTRLSEIIYNIGINLNKYTIKKVKSF